MLGYEKMLKSNYINVITKDFWKKPLFNQWRDEFGRGRIVPFCESLAYEVYIFVDQMSSYENAIIKDFIQGRKSTGLINIIRHYNVCLTGKITLYVMASSKSFLEVEK